MHAQLSNEARTQGYKTFFILNSNEHEISTPHIGQNAILFIYFLFFYFFLGGGGVFCLKTCRCSIILLINDKMTKTESISINFVTGTSPSLQYATNSNESSTILNLISPLCTSLLQNSIPFFWKLCRSRSAGFIRSQLIRIHTVFHPCIEAILIIKLHHWIDWKSKVYVAQTTHILKCKQPIY